MAVFSVTTIRRWGQLLGADPQRYVLLDEFLQGGEYAIVREEYGTGELHLGSAVKPAFPKMVISMPPDISLPVIYGRLNVFSRRLEQWDETVKWPMPASLGLLKLRKEEYSAVCVPLEMLSDMEFVTLY